MGTPAQGHNPTGSAASHARPRVRLGPSRDLIPHQNRYLRQQNLTLRGGSTAPVQSVDGARRRITQQNGGVTFVTSTRAETLQRGAVNHSPSGLLRGERVGAGPTRSPGRHNPSTANQAAPVAFVMNTIGARHGDGRATLVSMSASPPGSAGVVPVVRRPAIGIRLQQGFDTHLLRRRR